MEFSSKTQTHFHNKMMISTPLRSKLLSNSRSSSLPSRSHPLIPQFNEHLHRLNSSEATTPSSLSSIAKKLNNLDDLYNCIDDLLLLPHTNQVFAQLESREKWAEEIVDGYLTLVDACAVAKDSISHAKEYVLNLLSVLRRRRASDDLSGFLNSRKTAKKMVQRSLRSISSGFKNKPFSMALDKDQETIAIISMLKEAESITVDLIESLLTSIAGIKGHHHHKQSGWSLVSRLMKKASGPETVEFREMDANLCKIVSLRMSKCDTSLQIDELQQQLRDMDPGIQIVEERVERLFKRLIKTRVSLLNMMSQ